jgi:hypothetical protein
LSLILLDESVPAALRRLLPGHDVRSTSYMGWSGLKNGELIARAESEGFEIVVTADQSILYQQNMTGRRLSLIVLDTNFWPAIRAAHQSIAAAIEAATPGNCATVAVPRSPHRQRG